MSDLHRWNDDRLDDMSKTVHALAEAQHRQGRQVDRHEADLKRIARTGDRRIGRRWDLILVGLTIAGTNIATIIAVFTQAPR